jgi:aldose 1-epimerase
MKKVELVAGFLTLGLVPEMGGSIAWFRMGRHDLMRPLTCEAESRADVVGAAMFPMVPYANRITGNQFEFGGRTWQLEPNFPPEPLNVHGSGWHSAWHVERAGAGIAWLVLERIAPHEPYSYKAVQRFALGSEALVITTEVTNLGKFAMPFGFGHHPWFMRDPDATVSFCASWFWMEGPGYLPTEPIRTPPELDFSRARTLPHCWRNNNYGGWDGQATIEYPSRKIGLHMEAEPIFRNLMFYADPTKSVFCLEPQTHAAGVFSRLAEVNLPESGVIILAPGESASGSVSFAPYAL